MTAILLTAIFTAAGTLAIASLRESWRQHGAAALALRKQLRSCSEWREVRVTIRDVTVHPQGAVILRPAFRERERSPAPARAIPAAA